MSNVLREMRRREIDEQMPAAVSRVRAALIAAGLPAERAEGITITSNDTPFGSREFWVVFDDLTSAPKVVTYLPENRIYHDRRHSSLMFFQVDGVGCTRGTPDQVADQYETSAHIRGRVLASIDTLCDAQVTPPPPMTVKRMNWAAYR